MKYTIYKKASDIFALGKTLLTCLVQYPQQIPKDDAAAIESIFNTANLVSNLEKTHDLFKSQCPEDYPCYDSLYCLCKRMIDDVCTLFCLDRLTYHHRMLLNAPQSMKFLTIPS